MIGLCGVTSVESTFGYVLVSGISSSFAKLKFVLLKQKVYLIVIVAPIYHYMPTVDNVVEWIGALFTVTLIVGSNFTILCS